MLELPSNELPQCALRGEMLQSRVAEAKRALRGAAAAPPRGATERR